MQEEDLEVGRLALERGLVAQKDIDEAASGIVTGAGTRLAELLLQKGLLTEDQVKALGDEARSNLRLAKAKAILEKLRKDEGKIPPEVTKALDQPGLHMGKYVRVLEIGQGTLGPVWKTWDAEANTWRALKLLMNFRRGNVKEFLDGAMAIHEFQGPGVAQCHEVGLTEGSLSIPYVVMDLVEGETLAKAEIQPVRAVATMREVATVLHLAHQAGLLHLDLHPGNIFLGPNGEVKITDFRLGPPLPSGDIMATQLLPRAMEIRGHPSYMAPEQALAREHDITVRTDVYALGSTLYFLLTGKPPHLGDSPVNTCLKVIHEEPRKPSELSSQVQGDLERIILRCMTKDPVKRYESAKQVADDLGRVLEGSPIQSDEELRFTQGIAALHAGRIEESIWMFKDMIRMSSTRETVVKKLEEGEAGVTLAIEQQKKNYDVRTQRGIIRMAKAILLTLDGKDPAAACKGSLDDFTAATALRPENSTARVNSANILTFSARYASSIGKSGVELYKLALNELNQACELDRTHATAFHNRGTVFFYAAREAKRGGADAENLYLKAIDDFTAALILEPSNAYVQKDLGVVKIALAKYRLAQGKKVKDLYEQALDHLTKAIRVNAGLYGAWFERGHAHFAVKAFNHAVKDWERALEIDPSRAEAVRPLIDEARQWVQKRGTLPSEPV